VGWVRKPKVSGTENGSEEAESASFKNWRKAELTAITIGAQGRISCTDCEWYIRCTVNAFKLTRWRSCIAGRVPVQYIDAESKESLQYCERSSDERDERDPITHEVERQNEWEIWER